MFTIQIEQGLNCPRIVCDGCRQVVDVSAPDHQPVMQIWDYTKQDKAEGGYLADHIYHAHIGPCWGKVAGAIKAGGGQVHYMNLEGQLSNLLHNTGFDVGPDPMDLLRMPRAERERAKVLKVRKPSTKTGGQK
jgi:hypothetical protein